jgi:hypothetical protein
LGNVKKKKRTRLEMAKEIPEDPKTGWCGHTDFASGCPETKFTTGSTLAESVFHYIKARSEMKRIVKMDLRLDVYECYCAILHDTNVQNIGSHITNF